MAAMPGAVDCLQRLRSAGFAIAVCSNWGWDLRADLRGTGLVEQIDVFVPSAQAGIRSVWLTKAAVDGYSRYVREHAIGGADNQEACCQAGKTVVLGRGGHK